MLCRGQNLSAEKVPAAAAVLCLLAEYQRVLLLPKNRKEVSKYISRLKSLHIKQRQIQLLPALGVPVRGVRLVLSQDLVDHACFSGV